MKRLTDDDIADAMTYSYLADFDACYADNWAKDTLKEPKLLKEWLEGRPRVEPEARGIGMARATWIFVTHRFSQSEDPVILPKLLQVINEVKKSETEWGKYLDGKKSKDRRVYIGTERVGAEKEAD